MATTMFYILQKDYLNTSYIFFEDLLPFIILGISASPSA